MEPIRYLALLHLQVEVGEARQQVQAQTVALVVGAMVDGVLPLLLVVQEIRHLQIRLKETMVARD
jgi:hypothetical protein